MQENFPINSKLTHLDNQGGIQMVDVSSKPVTVRQAVASGQVRMLPETFRAIEAGNAPKGDVLGTAKLAGIMAAEKKTAPIPPWHPLPLHQKKGGVITGPGIPGYQN